MMLKFTDNFDTAYVDLFASSYNLNFIKKFEDYNPYDYYGVFLISQCDKLGKSPLNSYIFFVQLTLKTHTCNTSD